MEQAIFYVAILITIGMAAFTVHISRNPVLKKKNRTFLVLASVSLIIVLLTESFSLLMEGHPEYNTVYMINLTICMVASIWIIPCQLLGFSFPKIGKIISGVGIIYTILFIAAVPRGLVYYISADGIYQAGSRSILLTSMLVLWSCISLIILVGLGIRFHSQHPVILILIAGIEILSQIFSSIGTYDIIRTLGMAFAFLLVYSYFENLTEQQLYSELEVSNNRNKELSLQVVNALVSAVDAKDKYTNGHSCRVADYSVLLAEKLGWDENNLFQLKYDALLHDVGKIGVPDSVLNKPGRLSNAEFDIIKSHTVFGANILSKMTTLPSACQAARWHHERFDGKGYPDKIAGKDIPENVRIISIADTFDAMNSDRIYRRALSKDIIIKELEKGKGTQFDPELADVFIELYQEGATDEIAAEGRQDLQNDAEDSFSEELREFFGAFREIDSEQSDSEEDQKKSEQMRNSLMRIADNNQTNIEIALITVKAAADFSLTDEALDSAIDVMQKAISSTVAELVVVGRISKTQIIVIRRIVDGPDLGQFLQMAFVYYYKIFNAEGLDVSFEILHGVNAN